MGSTMTKPLCVPVLDERGLHVMIQTVNGTLVRSHILDFGEIAAFLELGVKAQVNIHAKEKCKCD
jgi:hypothetical protein